ncbi:type I-B CRISPR-associated endonuclease Cas1b [Clostridium botulinum]|uniref:CRISPR-associated endonuclease Cas1 n=1 Tax=Clostridium botulinum TaxID=1491 RepID=A0A6B4JRL1_CLOBO|nr:type I-B CRISPR-associated endonuclease Cas1b [Clostridium botulinum]EES50339.1 crispr-associated protein Cas1 [Clostridium botulinum E1 str. 'BoNT E Beluga']MBY6762916.1 type I-B CRISPR-associated endonuclease Cas1 [Clostridium botulinum]MBY6921749.1 type I-B CRISPR-associated endonuclease Cas1 [Clostridium botulinum]MCR1131580.1 type I-B CRISPR-associated endonuclease Cas1b [Clostridium botulinum]NFJ59614.1 type I-B CRISPR-associated endonuclease Cas1 [Clostridium botulinum]
MGKDYYIFSNGRIKRKDNTIYFIDEDSNKRGLPIEDIERLHLFGEIDMNTKFLNYISKYSMLISIYNYYGFYSGTYYSRKKNVSGILLVNQSEAYTNKNVRLSIAKSFIDSAFHHILRNLRRHDNIPKELIDRIIIERKNINEAKTIEELMGAEGRGRKKYYESFNYFLKNEFYFNRRQKRPPTDPINALISFGNSMMYTTTLGEIYKTQLDPTISYLHEPSTRRFSLSLDISEIFKPIIVDSVIFTLINKNMITSKDFNIENGLCYLNEDGKKKFIREYENKLSTTIKHRALNRKVSYRTLIKLECYKLIKYLIENEKYKALKAWW